MKSAKLSEQKNLMALGVKIANEIEVIDTYLEDIDPVRAKMIRDMLLERYCEVIARLMSVMPVGSGIN